MEVTLLCCSASLMRWNAILGWIHHVVCWCFSGSVGFEVLVLDMLSTVAIAIIYNWRKCKRVDQMCHNELIVNFSQTYRRGEEIVISCPPRSSCCLCLYFGQDTYHTEWCCDTQLLGSCTAHKFVCDAREVEE